MISSKGARIFLHVFLWVLIYFLPFFVVFGSKALEAALDDFWIIHAVSTLLLVAYTYSNHYLLIPKFYLYRKYFAYVAIVIVCGMIVLWFPNIFRPEKPPGMHLGQHRGGPPKGGPGMSVFFGLGYNVILFIICTLGAIGVRQQLQLLEVQKEKLNAELSFLKAQINPHFLFNTLNSIYSLAIQKSDDTPKAVIQLSELMRYLLKDANADYVALEKEVAYINNYVALQRRRLGDTVYIYYESPQGITDQRIAPLLLMSFIENAFKHGVNPDQDSAISIVLHAEGSQLHFKVINNKVTSVNQEAVLGIGLKNARARLEHLYPKKHQLLIEDGEKTFSVNLKIDLS